jgi:hypothetical protein
MGGDRVMTGALPVCAICHAEAQRVDLLKGWTLHLCSRCMENVWACPSCGARNRKSRQYVMVHAGAENHAFYRQRRLV